MGEPFQDLSNSFFCLWDDLPTEVLTLDKINTSLGGWVLVLISLPTLHAPPHTYIIWKIIVMENYGKNDKKEFYHKLKVMVLTLIGEIEIGQWLSLSGY